ncbi:MAG: S-layer homology domain-containing protein [Eubacterium sp.]|jgi:hypothetical protein|nr:S-layer homology domain-containing protein [Eubacterium sp.]
MKKTISALLSATMIISATMAQWSRLAVAAAADDKNLEAAILTSKERIDIPKEFSKFNFEKTTSMGQSGYILNWSKTDNTGDEINVTIVDDVILNYSKHENIENVYDGREKRFAKLTKDELYNKAAQGLKKLNPTVYENIRIDKDSYSAYIGGNTASFRIYRTANEIDVSGDEGNIYVNKDTGALSGLNFSWLKGVTLESNKNIVSQQTAKASFGRVNGIEPIYAVKSDYEEKKQSAVIIYRSKANDYISAKIGSKSDFQPNYYGWNGWETFADEEVLEESNAGSFDLSKDELEKVEAEKGLITAKEALEKLMSSDIYLEVGKNATLRSSDLNYDYFDNTRYVWDLNISFKNEQNVNTTAYATINAETGATIGYSYYSGKTVSDKINEKSADSLVDSALDKFLGGSKFAEYKLISIVTQTEQNELLEERQDSEPGTKYYGRNYVYSRYVNGIRVREDNINVSVNPDGKITDFRYGYTNIKFPSASKILTNNQALRELYAQQDMDLKYYINVTQSGDNEVKTSALLYSMPYFYLNATTGKLCDYNGDEVNSGEYSYSDISKHSIRNIAEKLSENGIMLPSVNGKLLPDTSITPEDFRELVNGMGVYIPHIENAENKNSKKTLTRREGVIEIVNGLGGEEFASLASIYASPFKDVAEKDKGYFAIAYGMKILTPNKDGNISPDKNLTRAQALYMVYNYLNR